MNYTMRPAAKGSPTELRIYGDIGPDPWAEESADAKNIAAALDGVTGPLTVRINSYGGAVADGLAIYNALRRHKGSVAVTVDGVAFSIASLIAMAGSFISMADNSLMMIHAPWGGAIGNAKDMRDMADILDRYAEAMTGAYARVGGPDADTIRGWLTDGGDHYFSATEALDAGLIDQIDQATAFPIAAALRDRYAIPAAYAALTNRRPAAMADDIQTPAVAPVPAATQTPAEIVGAYTDASKAGQEAGARAEAKRQADIRSLYALRPFKQPQIVAVLDHCLTDIRCDRATAMDRALAAVEALPESQPINASAPATAGGAPWAGTYAPPPSYGPATPGAPSQSATGIRAALEIRSGLITDRDAVAKERGSEFLSMSLVDLMGRELRAMGHKVGGSREDIARAYVNAIPVMAAGPGQGTDNLTNILSDVANKSAMQGWDASEEVWSRWVQQGTLNDYRAAERANLALLDKLTLMAERQEWEYGDMKDVKQSIQGYFHGLKYGLSIQAIVNDDLGELTRAFQAWGEAANATVGDAVHALLTVANTTYGQTMDEDSVALFNAASHFNYASGAGAPSITTLGAARKAMMTQSDPNGRTVGIRPKYIIHGPTLAPTVWTLTTATTLIDGTATAAQGNLNWAQGLGLVPIEEYRMDSFFTTAWILAAARRTVEVSGVGGPLAPRVERSMISNIPGITYEMSMPFGCAVLDWRGMYMHKGA